jgi:hypothetical protein
VSSPSASFCLSYSPSHYTTLSGASPCVDLKVDLLPSLPSSLSLLPSLHSISPTQSRLPSEPFHSVHKHSTISVQRLPPSPALSSSHSHRPPSPLFPASYYLSNALSGSSVSQVTLDGVTEGPGEAAAAVDSFSSWSCEEDREGGSAGRLKRREGRSARSQGAPEHPAQSSRARRNNAVPHPQRSPLVLLFSSLSSSSFLPLMHVLARRSRDGYDRRYHTLLRASVTE